MSEFKLPEIRFIPDVDEMPITLENLKAQIEWINSYNLQSRLGADDPNGDPVPVRYIGKNRYWIHESEGVDPTVGSYAQFSVYDLDPRAPDGRRLLVRYKLTDEEGNIVQTVAMARKHIEAARLEAERSEAMKRKDPKLNETVKIHMPAIYTPEEAIKKAMQ
jgi:hypothetical protein